MNNTGLSVFKRIIAYIASNTPVSLPIYKMSELTIVKTRIQTLQATEALSIIICAPDSALYINY